MKKLSILYKVSFLVVLAAFFFASCDPDPVLTDDPTIAFVEETGFISASTTIDGTSDFKVKVSASQGTNEMNTLTIKRDGVDIDPSEFSIEGIPTVNNPQLLFDGDRTSFTYEITITPHATGEASYDFVVTASDNTDASISLNITIDDVDPTLSIDGPTSISLPNPSTVEVKLVGNQGSSPLSTIAVYEDGSLILDTDRLACNELTNKFTANPNPLDEADKSGFNKSFFIKSSNEIATKVYTITITDEAGKEASVEYTITVEPLDTPFTTEFTNVRMYNNSGAEFGAIDLDAGANVSSSNADADLIDSGIDGDGNWLQTMAPLGSTDLRSIDVTYDGTTTREQLVAAFDAGTSLASTGLLEVGSTYAAKIGDDYYIMTVVTVQPTSADNNDYIEFNIKQSKG